MLEGPPDPHPDPYKQPETFALHDAPTEAYHGPPPPEYVLHAEQRPLQAGRLIQRNQGSSAPAGPLHQRLLHLWHKDPAYKVLFIAIAVVLVSSLVSAAVLASFVAQLTPTPRREGNLPVQSQSTPTLAVPTPQLNATPTAEATPQPTPTPVIEATPTPMATAPAISQPTPNPDTRLTVQITSLPSQINNNAVIPVTVTTNEPGASVTLLVTYSAIPLFYTSDPQATDANGNTTFSWSVHEHTFSPFTRMVTANVTAVAHDQNHQRATSQTLTVHVLTK